MEMLSTLISLLALGLTGYVYFAHDRKLNAQQKLLNELALQKAAQEDVASKKAIIFLRHERIGSSDKLIVTNKGQATAYDVRLSSQVEEDPVMTLSIPPQWDSLKPGQEVKRPIALVIGSTTQVTYDITWRDELGEHKDQQMVDYL